MAEAFIVGAVRSAIGKKDGRLAPVRPDDLVARVLEAVVARTGVDPTEVQDVILGCVDQVGEQGLNIARNAALIAGLPLDVCGVTLDRMCGSGHHVHRLRPGHRDDHRASVMASYRCQKCGKTAPVQKVCCGRPMKKAG